MNYETEIHFYKAIEKLFNIKDMDSGSVFSFIKNLFFKQKEPYMIVGMIYSCISYIHDELKIDTFVTRYNAAFDIKDNKACIIVSDKPPEYNSRMQFIVPNILDIKDFYIDFESNNSSIKKAINRNSISIPNSYMNSLENVLASILEYGYKSKVN